jgi:gliding motility-associated-like protein
LTENFDIITNPTVIIESDLTNCTTPNGALSVSIAGEVDSYFFTWFANDTASGNPIGSGTQLNGLDIGTYSVTAEHRQSGCTSMAVQEISDDRIYPEFDIVAPPSTCGDSNGSIIIIAADGTVIERIEWVKLDENGQIDVGFGTITSPNFLGQTKGNYQFTVYGRGECPITSQATIQDDIIVYNGVSPNDDLKNDHFIISCIEEFENNIVKIYNRAGQLIYQAAGYDNEDVRFTGIGNRGIYLSGKQVPEGTYFYIVDKNDGSTPHAGYLELVR